MLPDCPGPLLFKTTLEIVEVATVEIKLLVMQIDNVAADSVQEVPGRSWDTTMSVFFHYVHKYSSGHSTARRSRWLVGSSRSSKVGCMKSARAREMRILQPPLNSLVAFAWLAWSNPNPQPRKDLGRACPGGIRALEVELLNSHTPWRDGRRPRHR
jgi:hypothetical protein